MTVNERLFTAGLISEYDAAKETGDLTAINAVLAKVGLRQGVDGMNSAIEDNASAGRKTLQIKPASEQDDAAPAIRKKGRGWEISESRLDTLHDRAREMRRNPSEAHKALADKFAEADLGKYSFKRFAVVGSAIVDFNCHNLGMAIDIDEEGESEALATRRDKSLEVVGIKVMRLKASDILENMDAVLDRITAGMRIRIGERQTARAKHFEQRRGTGQGYKPRTFRAGPRDN